MLWSAGRFCSTITFRQPKSLHTLATCLPFVTCPSQSTNSGRLVLGDQFVMGGENASTSVFITRRKHSFRQYDGCVLFFQTTRSVRIRSEVHIMQLKFEKQSEINAKAAISSRHGNWDTKQRIMTLIICFQDMYLYHGTHTFVVSYKIQNRMIYIRF
jgi:hypothetical protein